MVFPLQHSLFKGPENVYNYSLQLTFQGSYSSFTSSQFQNTLNDRSLNNFPKVNDLLSVLCANLDLLPTADIILSQRMLTKKPYYQRITCLKIPVCLILFVCLFGGGDLLQYLS